ncbi:hypothetical protein ACKWTF_008352 [Chironomus riparius]
MATELKRNQFKEIVECIFNRWSALKLAVEHGMAKNGLQTALDFVDYVTDSCVLTNSKVSEEDLMDLLEDILDQEFDTVCQDQSTKEISNILLRYLELLNSGQLELIKSELTALSPCNNWIVKGNKINIIKDPEDDSSSGSDDEDMESDSTNNKDSNGPSTSGSTMQVEEEDVDPGWTIVKKGKRKN